MYIRPSDQLWWTYYIDDWEGRNPLSVYLIMSYYIVSYVTFFLLWGKLKHYYIILKNYYRRTDCLLIFSMDRKSYETVCVWWNSAVWHIIIVDIHCIYPLMMTLSWGRVIVCIVLYYLEGSMCGCGGWWWHYYCDITGRHCWCPAILILLFLFSHYCVMWWSVYLVMGLCQALCMENLYYCSIPYYCCIDHTLLSQFPATQIYNQYADDRAILPPIYLLPLITSWYCVWGNLLCVLEGGADPSFSHLQAFSENSQPSPFWVEQEIGNDIPKEKEHWRYGEE